MQGELNFKTENVKFTNLFHTR